jgi:large subunit ribosomal protein L4
MAVVNVHNLEGKAVGKLELADGVFAARPNPHLLHETVRWYLAWQRAGTHKTKGRGEVEGSGKKLWRQKGTGRARMGSIRSPIWRKGGTVHGPRPRSYRYALPKKMFAGALRSALSAKLAAEQLTVVEGFALDTHKTKPFRQVLNRFDGEAATVLVVDLPGNRNLELASRNLEGVKRVVPTELQPYDLLRHDRLILSKDAAVKLSTALSPKGEAAPAAAAPEGKPARAKKPVAARSATGAKKPRAKKD